MRSGSENISEIRFPSPCGRTHEPAKRFFRARRAVFVYQRREILFSLRVFREWQA